MIIFLDESLAVSVENPETSASVISAMQICAQQVYEGNHVIFGRRSVFDAILRHREIMGARTAAILARSAEKLTQRKSLKEFVQRLIRLVADSVVAEPELRQVNDCCEIIIPVSSVRDCSSLLAKSILMVENLSDASFYKKLAEFLVGEGIRPEWDNLRNVPLRVDVFPGGGRTIANLYQHHKEIKERVGLAIADGDYRYPGSAAGATALALVGLHEESPTSALLDVFVLPFRTVENCIPRESIRILMNNLDVVQGYRAGQLIDLLSNSAFWGLYPIKNGVRCYELGQASNESVFWTSIAGNRRCSDAPCENKRSCSVFVLPSLSSRLLGLAASEDFLLERTASCNEGVFDVWNALVKLMYSFFCGGEKLRMI